MRAVSQELRPPDRPMQNDLGILHNSVSCTSNSIILCYGILGNSNEYDGCVCMITKSRSVQMSICHCFFILMDKARAVGIGLPFGWSSLRITYIF